MRKVPAQALAAVTLVPVTLAAVTSQVRGAVTSQFMLVNILGRMEQQFAHMIDQPPEQLPRTLKKQVIHLEVRALIRKTIVKLAKEIRMARLKEVKPLNMIFVRAIRALPQEK